MSGAEAGGDTRKKARFSGGSRLERQILASLSHGAIAQMIDGGVTDDGHPALILEYVEGVPIDQYADEARLGLEGKSVIMISSELPEILRMSDRIIVMCEGRLTGELPIEEASQEAIMKYATMGHEEVLSRS